ncbi:MAG TPA: hypothetical protein VFU63_12245 [Ktedonobacterales bacterium]|nr:hypothetical protein [Ktedonobacterales bacterium]
MSNRTDKFLLIAEEQERRYRKMRTAFSVTYMSDTKWRKMVMADDTNDVNVPPKVPGVASRASFARHATSSPMSLGVSSCSGGHSIAHLSTEPL